MNLLQDILKILHQPVQLLIAALMYAYKEPKRKFWLIRAVLAAILGFLVLEFCITASPEILLNSFLTSLVWSIGSFLILLSIEYSMFDVELKMAAYFTTLAYLTQHVAFCAWDASCGIFRWKPCVYKYIFRVLLDCCSSSRTNEIHL